jgi:hypothetical protein
VRVLTYTALVLAALCCSLSATQFEFVNTSGPRAEQMRAVLQNAAARLEKLLEVDLPPRIEVVIVQTGAEFDSVARGQLPEWGAAAAVPHRDLIILREPMLDNYPGNRANLLEHELAHIALHYKIKFHRLPRFLDEGFAAWFAGEWRFSNLYAVLGAQLTKSLIPLRQIDGVTSFNHPQATLAYSQSYLVILYLFNEHGEFAWVEFLEHVAAGRSFDDAWRRTFRAPFWEFEAGYRKFLSENYSAVAILSDMTALWIILAIIVIAGFIVIKRRKKHMVERWKEEEKYQSTDFDYDQDDSPWN